MNFKIKNIKSVPPKFYEHEKSFEFYNFIYEFIVMKIILITGFNEHRRPSIKRHYCTYEF